MNQPVPASGSMVTRPASGHGWSAVYALDFGRIGLIERDDRIVELVYLPGDTAPLAPLTALGREVGAQLRAYCRDPDHRFDLPLHDAGTEFQRRVWQLLRDIPRGRVLRYGEAAQQLGSAARAVGQACRANPFPPLVPCHRIVAAGGLGGFAGAAADPDDERLHVKRWLLRHEGVADV